MAQAALGIDALTLQRCTISVTFNHVSDASELPDLLQQLPEADALEGVIGDGVCDTQPVHEAIIRRSAKPVIAPRKNFCMRKERVFEHRNAAMTACSRLGPTIWTWWRRYHRRRLVETKMHGIKRLLERVMSRYFARQVNELHIRAGILNCLIKLAVLRRQSWHSHGWGSG